MHRIVYLRFGGLDVTVPPIRGYQDIAEIMDKNCSTICNILRRFISRDESYLDLRKLNAGRKQHSLNTPATNYLIDPASNKELQDLNLEQRCKFINKKFGIQTRPSVLAKFY